MTITVRLFALLRELYGAKEATLVLPEGATVAEALSALFPEAQRQGRFPRSLLFAVNRGYVSAAHVLKDGDELVFVPPVSGG